MPVTQKRKATKGIPGKAHNPNRKRRYQLYLDQSTCPACHLVFRTPAYKKKHWDSHCDSKVGLRKVK